MKRCSQCIYLRYDYTLEKVFKCRLQDKHFDNPKMHGMCCKHYKNKIIMGGINCETDGQDAGNGNC